jgi:hypothetical protein
VMDLVVAGLRDDIFDPRGRDGKPRIRHSGMVR